MFRELVQHTYVLTKREYWENKKLVFISLLIILGISWSLIISDSIQTHHFIMGNTLDKLANTPAYFYSYHISYHFNSAYLYALWFIVGIYLLHSLHGEKKQNNRLFWLSLPLNPFEDLLSKWFMALVVIPLICLMIFLINSVVSIMFISIQYMVYHHGVFPTWYWNVGGVCLSLLQLSRVYCYQACLLLPVLSWLFFCSCISSKPYLLALSPVIIFSILDLTTDPKNLWLLDHSLFFLKNKFDAAVDWGMSSAATYCDKGHTCIHFNKVDSLVPHHNSLWSLMNYSQYILGAGVIVALLLIITTYKIRSSCVQNEVTTM